MDFAQLILQLLAGVFLDLGVEAKDFKLVIVANEDDLNLKPIKQIQLTMRIWPMRLSLTSRSSSKLRISSCILMLALKPQLLVMSRVATTTQTDPHHHHCTKSEAKVHA